MCLCDVWGCVHVVVVACVPQKKDKEEALTSMFQSYAAVAFPSVAPQKKGTNKRH